MRKRKDVANQTWCDNHQIVRNKVISYILLFFDIRND